MRLCSDILDQEPAHSEASKILGDLYLYEGKNANALQHFG